MRWYAWRAAVDAAFGLVVAVKEVERVAGRCGFLKVDGALLVPHVVGGSRRAVGRFEPATAAFVEERDVVVALEGDGSVVECESD